MISKKSDVKTKPVCSVFVFTNSGSPFLRFVTSYGSGAVKDRDRLIMLEILLAEMRGSKEVTIGDVDNARAVRDWVRTQSSLFFIHGTVSRITCCVKSYVHPKKFFHFAVVKLTDGSDIVLRGEFDKILKVGDKVDVEARPCLAQDEGRDVYSVPRSAYEGDLSKSRLLKALKRAV